MHLRLFIHFRVFSFFLYPSQVQEQSQQIIERHIQNRMRMTFFQSDHSILLFSFLKCSIYTYICIHHRYTHPVPNREANKKR